MTYQELEQAARLLADVDAATALLPEADRTQYAEAQESVIRAREEAQRQAGQLWIY